MESWSVVLVVVVRDVDGLEGDGGEAVAVLVVVMMLEGKRIVDVFDFLENDGQGSDDRGGGGWSG